MANEKNLIPKTTLSKEEAKRMGQKGGKKSAEVRREKKLLKQLLEEALEAKTKTGNRYIDITNALIQEAEKGNVKAYETIRDTLEQKPKTQIEHTGNINNPFSELSTEELRQLIKDE